MLTNPIGRESDSGFGNEAVLTNNHFWLSSGLSTTLPMVIHDNLSDFILFLYVHMSNADSTYDPVEMDVIKMKMAMLYPQGTDMEKKLYQAIREYNGLDKTRMTDILKDSFAKFGDQFPSKSELYNDLQEIMLADGVEQSEEQDALELLKYMINHAKS